MHALKSSTLALTCLLGSALFTGIAEAQPAAHPDYFAALNDLRYARASLAKPTGKQSVAGWEGDAIGHIDGAIANIKKAAYDDHKSLDEHPAVAQDDKGRLVAAERALSHAHTVLEHGDDEPKASGLKARAEQDIDAAWQETKDAIKKSH